MTEEWMDDAWSDSEACPPEWMLSFYNVPRLIVGTLTALQFGTFGTSMIIAALFLLFGLFIDAIPAA